MSDKLRRVLMGIFVVIFCVAAGVFGKSMFEYYQGEQIYESAMEFVNTTDVDETVESSESEDNNEDTTEKKKVYIAPISNVKRTYTSIDFKGLQAVNPDVIGWIQILGTQVDYPLLDADDNQYYLNHTYDNRRSSYGSIFLEPRNASDFMQNHIVIYGHNMVNKSMFGSLLQYKQQGFADNHSIITISTPGGDLTYKVFSAYTAHVNSATYRLGFSSVASFNEMISHMKENSMIKSNITPKAGDQVLTLSTCTPAGAKEYRFVVNAVLISGNKTVNKIPEKAADVSIEIKSEEVVTEEIMTEEVLDEQQLLTEEIQMEQELPAEETEEQIEPIIDVLHEEVSG